MFSHLFPQMRDIRRRAECVSRVAPPGVVSLPKDCSSLTSREQSIASIFKPQLRAGDGKDKIADPTQSSTPAGRSPGLLCLKPGGAAEVKFS